MLLRYGIISEKVEEVSDGGMGRKNIIGTIDHATTNHIPFKIPTICVILKFEGNISDIGEHRLEVKLVDIDHEDVVKPLPFLFEMGQPDSKYPGSPSLCTIVLNISDIAIKKPGPYEFLIKVDNRHLGSIPFYVYEVIDPEGS